MGIPADREAGAWQGCSEGTDRKGTRSRFPSEARSAAAHSAGTRSPGVSPRALFYCHDTVGLGHFRRTLAIAQGLMRSCENLSVLILTGSPMAHAFRVDQGIDYVKLPSVRKLDNEVYESRSLKVSFETVWQIRRDLIYRTAQTYRPDFFFVDNVPLGMKEEILETLRFLQEQLPETRRFLILRDILDDAGYLVPFWNESGGFEALESFYDRIFICGQPAVYDTVEEYHFPPSLRVKTRFCGYIPRDPQCAGREELRRRYCSNGEKLVLVTVGGGSDGAHLVRTYMQSLSQISLLYPVSSVVLLGPEMDASDVCRVAADCPAKERVTMLDFSDESLGLMEAADMVVSMAGYNTVNEIVWLRKAAVVVPRIRPRSEQLIRSQRLQELSFLEMIHPDGLTPRRLAEAVVRGLEGKHREPRVRLSFDAIDLISRELKSFLGQDRRPTKPAVRSLMRKWMEDA